MAGLAAASLLLGGAFLLLRLRARMKRLPLPGVGAMVGGDYRLVRELGRGAAGTSFEAVDLSLGRRVAVRRLREGLAPASSALKHPNIVETYSVLREGGRVYVVSEFFDGRPLSDLRRLPLASVKSVVRQAAAALDYAHGQGVVHGGLGLGDILAASDGRVKLTGFGLAPGARDADIRSLAACALELLAGQTPGAEAALARRFRSAAELSAALDAL